MTYFLTKNTTVLPERRGKNAQKASGVAGLYLFIWLTFIDGISRADYIILLSIEQISHLVSVCNVERFGELLPVPGCQ
ncbi:MAG: hypothetical protein ACTXOO_05690 [Sodalis sp. (in: enterobacteria)]